MNKIFIWLIIIISFSTEISIAQKDIISDAYKINAINKISQLLNERYVFPDVAKLASDHLQRKLTEGNFKELNTLDTFSRVLTSDLRLITKDQHIKVIDAHAPPSKRLTDIGIQGFKDAKILENNIGYIDLRLFVSPLDGSPIADSIMKIVEKADALIIDMRNNAGGSPDMLVYLCSYFFDKKTHLDNIHWRWSPNYVNELWTTDVKGKKRPDVPLFFLTSKITFSAGEAFCYDMQMQKRAVIVGEVTGGGAHIGGMVPINENLSIFIPMGKLVNPISKANWEGTGVQPDIKIEAPLAYNRSIELAKEAIRKKAGGKIIN